MSSAITPTPAKLHWDESGQPVSTRYNEPYFLRHSGLAESRYLFLEQNHLQARWQNGFPQETFYIGETGFGTGLNFLAAWQAWEENAAVDKQLHFISVENEPLQRADLAKALALWPELADYAEALLAVYPQLPTTGFHHFVFAGQRVKLSLIIDDPATGMNQLLMSNHPLYRKPFHRGMDAWFLAGFAPAENPSMWKAELFDVIAALSDEQCSLVASTAAGAVQEDLERVGFRTDERPGHNKGRNTLAASYVGQPQPEARDFGSSLRHSPYPTPWHVAPSRQSAKIAVVIGAGLAGSHTARALAERGWQVTVLEQAATVASGASGNAQGIVYGKLSRDMDAAGRFNLSSLLYAQRFYQDYWRGPSFAGELTDGEPADEALPADERVIGEQCGLLQLAFNDKERQIRERLKTSFAGTDDFLRFVEATQASEIAGIPVESPCMYFPQLGWLSPALLCRQLLDHPGITVQCNSSVATLKNTGASSTWRLLDKHGQLLAEAPNVVVANAHHALGFPSTRHLPLKAIRGQVSQFRGEQIPLKTVLCSDGYIAPAAKVKTTNKLQSFGATFTLHEQRPAVLISDHKKNLANLSASMPGLAPVLHNVDPGTLSGRASFRCTTADYLPLVGPAPDYSRFIDAFALLSKNAKAGIPTAGPYLTGLFMNLGHGSRGLAYTPLSAELLAAQMDGDVLPLPRDLATALNPARFIIRDLIRNRLEP